MTDSAATTLDTRGLTCPEPVMMLHNAVRDVAAGELVQVLATDPYLRAQIGEANRAKARKHFDAADMVAAYRRLYDSALGAGVIR